MWLRREWPQLDRGRGSQVVEYGAVLSVPTGEHLVVSILGMELRVEEDKQEDNPPEEDEQEDESPEVVEVESSDDEVS